VGVDGVLLVDDDDAAPAAAAAVAAAVVAVEVVAAAALAGVAGLASRSLCAYEVNVTRDDDGGGRVVGVLRARARTSKRSEHTHQQRLR